MIHNCKEIAAIINRCCSAYEMKNPLKNRGHWIGLFCLTLSDISAAILIYDKKTGRIKSCRLNRLN